MRHGRLSLGIWVLPLFLGGCFGEAFTSGGTCPSTGINTYDIFGQWKLTNTYSPPRTEAQLELDFDLLIVKKGTVLCSEQITNGSISGRNFIANYSHDVSGKKVTFYYADGTEETATYSFSGSCDTTQMRLSYSNGSETYKIFNPDYDEGDCSIE